MHHVQLNKKNDSWSEARVRPLKWYQQIIIVLKTKLKMTGMIPYPVSPQVELLDASQILEAGDFPT